MKVTLYGCLLVFLIPTQCGAGFTIRPYGLTLTLWNKDCHFQEQLEYISDRLKEIFPGVEPTYRDHSGVINYNYQTLSPNKKEVSNLTFHKLNFLGKGWWCQDSST